MSNVKPDEKRTLYTVIPSGQDTYEFRGDLTEAKRVATRRSISAYADISIVVDGIGLVSSRKNGKWSDSKKRTDYGEQ